jgi:mono/diheme cytochrome c family protein
MARLLLLATLLSTAAFGADTEAAKLYLEYCSVCHGDRGDGRSWVREMNPPPRDFTRREVAVALTRERMIDAVRNGRPGTAMTAWSARLSQAQIESVVAYIREEFFPKDAAPVERARATYLRWCATCHGADGRGADFARREMTPPPLDFAAASGISRERMILSVTYGRPQTAMVGWGTRLSASEIAEVVDWIRGTLMTGAGAASAAARATPLAGHPPMAGHAPPPPPSRAPEPYAADPDAPMPFGLVGDVDRGRALYLANCVACHGVAGDGKGPRAYFVFPKPRDFTSPAVRVGFDRPRFYGAIANGTNGTEMPAWKWVLEPQQIADIAEYLHDGFVAETE